MGMQVRIIAVGMLLIGAIASIVVLVRNFFDFAMTDAGNTVTSMICSIVVLLTTVVPTADFGISRNGVIVYITISCIPFAFCEITAVSGSWLRCMWVACVIWQLMLLQAVEVDS